LEDLAGALRARAILAAVKGMLLRRQVLSARPSRAVCVA
jgi:hypothetical protein